MADYIRSNILCQAYVHVEVDDEFDESVTKIDSLAMPFIKERVEFFLYSGAEVNFDSDEGSVKSRITIFGTLILALQGISNYKDFREGVLLLSDDVERVAQVAVTETLFAVRARNNNIIRTEVRTGVVGSLRRILHDIDRIHEENGRSTSRRQVERLDALREEIQKLIDNLQNAEDVDLVSGELYQLISELPEAPLPAPKERLHPSIVDMYKSRRLLLLKSVTKAGDARKKVLGKRG